ncbi:MAG: hypothetical protein ACM3RP_10920 [Chitinophagales bacterium]
MSKPKLLWVLALTVGLWALGSLSALAAGSSELIEHPERWDGQPLTFRGEVIGDIMRRGDRAVVNVNDGTYAIGIWLPVRAADELRFAGRSGVKGDTVEVRGTYHRACREHGGDPDIHAESLTVTKFGGPVPEPLHAGRAWLAVGLLLAALLLVAWEAFRKPPEVNLPQA